MEPIITIVVCLSITYLMWWYKNNGHIGRIKLNTFTEPQLITFCEDMISFHNESFGVTRGPKIKFSNLSKERTHLGERVTGLYIHHQKMIVIDIKYILEEDYNIRDLATLVSHEWQHFIDYSNGISYETVGIEMSERRAEDFGRRGGKELIKHMS